MNNWLEFFAMGGYARYVWLSYGLCALVLIVLIVTPVIQRKKLLRQLALKQKRLQS